MDTKQALINYYPNGSAWVAKSNQDSNLNKYLGGLSLEFQRLVELIEELKKELNPLTTNKLIREHEFDYGIPDDCFSIENKTLAERINQIQIKILMNGADGADDWEYIASLIGVNAQVSNGIDLITFPLTFPIPMIASEAEARYTIVVKFPDDFINPTFPMTFPITFGTTNTNIAVVQCIFNKLKPINSQILYYFA